MKYDIVVIGAGLGGLMSALTLVKQGYQVAVVEKHFKVGGYATNFIRKDQAKNSYCFDVSLHGIGNLNEGANLHHIFKELELLDSLALTKKQETATVLYQGEELDIPDDFEAYKVLLISRFPNEESNIERLFECLQLFHDDVEQVYKQGKIPKYFNEYQGITLVQFLKQYTQNEELIELFSFLWLYYGVPATELSALYYLLPWISYHMGGTYYIKGTSQVLSDVLRDQIRQYGGEFYLSHEVVDIVVEQKRVSRVVTKKNLTLEADQFIFNGDPNQLVTLMNNQESVQQFKQQLGQQTVGISLTQLYVGLDCLPQELGMTKADYFTMENRSEKNWRYIQEGEYAKQDMSITNYSLMDPNLNPEGGVFCVCIGDLMKHWPDRCDPAYQIQKERVTQILLDKVEAYFPGVKEHVTVLELGTPVTMKRYTNNSEGAVYGWAQTTKQAGFNRLSFKTPFENVYLAGSWTFPGGGFEGAIISGYQCAKLLLSSHQKETVPSFQPDMALKTFMIGMVAGFKRERSKGITDTYQFIFDGQDIFYITVANQKAKLWQDECPNTADVLVKTSYETWYQIGQGQLKGEEALMSGRLKLEGDLDVFMNIPLLFGEEISPATERDLFKAEPYIPITLAPWVLYWIAKHHLSPQLLALIAILYTLVVMFILKPKGFKSITKLEGITLLGFSLYGLLPSISPGWFAIFQPYLLDGILISGWFISAWTHNPITQEYSYYGYRDSMVRTNLFTQINRHLTLMWTLIFTVQFITVMLIPSPWANLIYLLSAFGGVASALYPKYKLTHM